MNAILYPAIKVKELWTTSPPPLYGLGVPDTECQCPNITVFMQCVGTSGAERRRTTLDKDITLRQTKDEYGREMAQSGVYDENGFRFSEQDLARPLWQFSNRCALNLNFMHNSSADHFTTTVSNIREQLRGGGQASKL